MKIYEQEDTPRIDPTKQDQRTQQLCSFRQGESVVVIPQVACNRWSIAICWSSGIVTIMRQVLVIYPSWRWWWLTGSQMNLSKSVGFGRTNGSGPPMMMLRAWILHCIAQCICSSPTSAYRLLLTCILYSVVSWIPFSLIKHPPVETVWTSRNELYHCIQRGANWTALR